MVLILLAILCLYFRKFHHVHNPKKSLTEKGKGCGVVSHAWQYGLFSTKTIPKVVSGKGPSYTGCWTEIIGASRMQ
jgi:hypothetical protein